MFAKVTLSLVSVFAVSCTDSAPDVETGTYRVEAVEFHDACGALTDKRLEVHDLVDIALTGGPSLRLTALAPVRNLDEAFTIGNNEVFVGVDGLHTITVSGCRFEGSQVDSSLTWVSETELDYNHTIALRPSPYSCPQIEDPDCVAGDHSVTARLLRYRTASD